MYHIYITIYFYYTEIRKFNFKCRLIIFFLNKLNIIPFVQTKHQITPETLSTSHPPFLFYIIIMTFTPYKPIRLVQNITIHN